MGESGMIPELWTTTFTPAKLFYGFIEQALDIRGICNISLNGYCIASDPVTFSYYLLAFGPVVQIVHDHAETIDCQSLGHSVPYSSGCPVTIATFFMTFSFCSGDH
jgi:hypothetical protein